MKTVFSRSNRRSSALALACVGLFVGGHASAASLQPVAGGEWGNAGLPSYVNMYIYVPDKLADKPPIVVASHHCQGTGTSTYNETKSSFVAAADKLGYVMIFPEATGHNCWDVGSAKSLKHDGGGDTQAIAQMVKYALAKYKADPTRVYAFGGSSGAMMTQALMGVYPDIFAAGVAISGVACGCWAEGYTGDSGSTQQWSGPCAGGSVTKTAPQWGDLTRSTFAGYTGHRPRLQLWHGTADTTINFKNLGESIKEWTNVLSLSEAPTATDTAKAGQTHQIWQNACGFSVLETFALDGVGHGVDFDTNTALAFLGLDKALAQDPEAAACSTAGGAGGGTAMGGSGGSAGSSGSAGASGNGPVGAGGMVGSGGHPASVGGASTSSGAAGVPASGGSPSPSLGGGGFGGVASGAGSPSGGSAVAAGDTDAGCTCSTGRRGRRELASSSALLLAALLVTRRRRRA
jgi:acetylxylan esterase